MQAARAHSETSARRAEASAVQANVSEAGQLLALQRRIAELEAQLSVAEARAADAEQLVARSRKGLKIGAAASAQSRSTTAAVRHLVLEQAIKDLFRNPSSALWSNDRIADFLMDRLPTLCPGKHYSRATIMSKVKRAAAKHRASARSA